MNQEEENYSYFVLMFLYYVDLLGITEWEMDFGITNDNCIAQTLIDLVAMKLVLEVNIEEIVDMSRESIEYYAKHEAFEVLLSHLSIDLFEGQDQIDHATHSIIHKLSGVIE